MSDDRLERALSDAIADIAGSGSPDYLDDILERTSRTRQRPWWTFPGRYTIMTPTLKFATAAGLAFVLGVAVSPRILPGDEGTVQAPASAGESNATVDRTMTEPPSRFTGRISLEPVVTQPTSETQQYEADGREWIVQSGTFELQSTVSSSDDRFSGELSQDMAWDEYWLPDRDPANERPRVMSDEWHLENDHGSWTGTWRTFHSGGPQEDMDFADTVVVFEGDGDYAGYHAIVHVDFEATSLYDWYYDIDGWIVEGRLPRG